MKPLNWRDVSHTFFIMFVGGIVLFSNLGGPRLWDRDEPRNAGCTAEMLERGDWVTPVFDGELRTHKPILLYWFMMTAYAVFGINEFAARFWSAALGIGTAMATYGIGRRLFSPVVGLWAAIILMTSLMFDVASRAATPDAVLIFWITLSLLIYVMGTFPVATTGDFPRAPERWVPSWPMSIAMYGCMGAAVLAKGPVGLILPTAVIGMYLLVMRLPTATSAAEGSLRDRLKHILHAGLRVFAPSHFLKTCWLMRPLTALTVVAIVALPWYFAVGLRTDGQWLRGFLLDHNLGRAAQSLEGHGGSFFYYPLALLVGFFPWSVFAAPTLLESVAQIRRPAPNRAGYVLAACWIGVFVVLFSIARTKLPSYITPCYPAVALLVGSFVVAWTRRATQCSAYWMHAALTCLALVGLVVVVAVPPVAARFLPGEQFLACLGLVPLLTAGAAYYFLTRDARQRAAVTLGFGAVLLTTALFAFGAPRVDSHQTFDDLVTAIDARSKSPQIGTLGVLEPSWVFYTGCSLDRLFAPELMPNVASDCPTLGPPRTEGWQLKPVLNIWHYLTEAPDRYAITTSDHLNRLEPLPEDVVVLATTPYFLQDESLVLLTSKNANLHMADRLNSSRQNEPSAR